MGEESVTNSIPAVRLKIKQNFSAEKQMDLIAEELIRVANDLGGAHKKEREKTIATWQGARPSWRYGVARVLQHTVLLTVVRIGDPFGKKKWGWLDEGTRVRYMHVSKDWKSKTKVNHVGSGSGRGHTIGLGPGLPGIEARNWNIIINEKLSKRLIKRANTAIKRGLNRRRRGGFSGVTAILR